MCPFCTSQLKMLSNMACEPAFCTTFFSSSVRYSGWRFSSFKTIFARFKFGRWVKAFSSQVWYRLFGLLKYELNSILVLGEGWVKVKMNYHKTMYNLMVWSFMSLFWIKFAVFLCLTSIFFYLYLARHYCWEGFMSVVAYTVVHHSCEMKISRS